MTSEAFPTTVLIAGCGYVGCALGSALAREGVRVWGLRRDPARLPDGVEPIAADLRHPESLRSVPTGLDAIVYAVSADAPTDEAYREAYVEGLRRLIRATGSPRRLVFASSTGVYGQKSGEWVDERSPTEPGHFTGIRMLEGEDVALDSASAATMVRFGGIYGPGRTRMLDAVRTGTATYSAGAPRYVNRIHRDDCAGALAHVLRLRAPEPRYLAVDDEPAPRREVLQWLAERIGAPRPRAAPQRSSSSRGATNKRCRNALLRASGYSLRYPTFREGYETVVETPGA